MKTTERRNGVEINQDICSYRFLDNVLNKVGNSKKKNRFLGEISLCDT
jgi:hypothetical protein